MRRKLGILVAGFMVMAALSTSHKGNALTTCVGACNAVRQSCFQYCGTGYDCYQCDLQRQACIDSCGSAA